MALLTHRNIEGTRLRYERKKTGDRFNLPLNDICVEIIERHRNECTGDYVLPIVLQPDCTGAKLEKHIQDRRSRITHYMLQTGRKLNLPINLTTYVARHTFATLARNKNVPIAAISELLGHEDIKTTQIYLKSLESNVLDVYLQKIAGL
jgi:integrase